MDFLEGLNPRQREAVEHAEGPLLVLAGAGSGKTRVITHRIAHLITAYQVPASGVLAVTFTNKAAGEMRERVHKLLAKASITGNALPTVATFHSFCVRLLRREGTPLAQVRSGFTPLFTIYDDDDQLSIIKAAFKNMGLDDKFMQPRAVLSRISHAKSHKETPEEIAQSATDPISTRFAAVYQRYQDRLLEANALDFDDLLLEAVRLLASDEETHARLNRRFEFLMVDEYQDTNRSQYELMRLLAGERKNVTVVGDEDQSIYGWRGANIRNILDFERDFPGAVTIRLEQNYRSTKNVLEAASAVVANNTERIGKWLWTDADAGDKITLYEAPDAEAEALWISDSIEARLNRFPNDTVAVLYRTNSQSRQIEEALRRYGRKYVVVGGLSFYHRAEVKDVLSYLKVLVTPQDNLTLLRIINTPARGIGRTTIDQLEQYGNEHRVPLWTAMEHLIEKKTLGARADAALAVFRNKMDQLSSGVESRPIADTMRSLLEETGYRKMLEEEGTEEAKTRLSNLDELLNAASDADERGEGLREFLDHAALVAQADSVDQKAPISLLTMHNAKGLEFPVVFIAGLEEGLFPHSRSIDSDSAMEEERRLCYVGMTRAEKKLHLSWARYRRRFGGGQPEASIRSRFLKEVPALLMETERGGVSTRVGNPWPSQVDLFAEQGMVRESAKKNLYTGKTYNSADAIRDFFSGQPGSSQGSSNQQGTSQAYSGRVPAGQPSQNPQNRGPVGSAGFQPSSPAGSYPAGSNRPAAPPMSGPRPVVVPPRAPQPGAAQFGAVKKVKKIGPGSLVEHAKYGRGTVMRLEGTGDDAKITVSFPGHGLKKLIAKYAGIKVE
ncbi:MAG: UvrD-helicase domain-containing protein [Acidobacteriota bacterium]